MRIMNDESIFINSINHNYFHLKINKILQTIRFNLLLENRRDCKQQYNLKYITSLSIELLSIDDNQCFYPLILILDLKTNFFPARKIEAKYLKKIIIVPNHINFRYA